jgi:hypothetical protein
MMNDPIAAKVWMNAADRQRLAFYLQLPRRQREIVCGVLRGLTNQQIAAEMIVVPGVVANRLTEIYARLEQVQGAVPSGRAARFDLVRFFGDFFERYPELDGVVDCLRRSAQSSRHAHALRRLHPDAAVEGEIRE